MRTNYYRELLDEVNDIIREKELGLITELEFRCKIEQALNRAVENIQDFDERYEKKVKLFFCLIEDTERMRYHAMNAFLLG